MDSTLSTWIAALAAPELTLDVVRCARFVVDARWRLESRCHDDHVVYLIHAGRTEGMVGRKAVAWVPGSLSWIGPGVTHAMRPAAGCQRLDMDILRIGLTRNGQVVASPRPSLHLRDGRPAAAAFAALIDAVRLPGAFQDLRTRAALMGLFATISEASRPRVARGLTTAQRSAIYAWLADHHAHAPEPADLARACGLAPAYFRRRFRLTFGQTPRTWLAMERLRWAGHLLRTTDLPIAAVAERCGYTAPEAFTRRFTAVHGVAPRAWRFGYS